MKKKFLLFLFMLISMVGFSQWTTPLAVTDANKAFGTPRPKGSLILNSQTNFYWKLTAAATATTTLTTASKILWDAADVADSLFWSRSVLKKQIYPRTPSALYVDSTWLGVKPAYVPSGAGIRLMWIPKKYAFRAGRVTGTQWDYANIGLGSVAFGSNTTASGTGSTAFGNTSFAIGNYSFAVGAGPYSYGPQTMSIGSSTFSGSENSFSGGYASLTNADNSFVFGSNCIIGSKFSYDAYTASTLTFDIFDDYTSYFASGNVIRGYDSGGNKILTTINGTPTFSDGYTHVVVLAQNPLLADDAGGYFINGANPTNLATNSIAMGKDCNISSPSENPSIAIGNNINLTGNSDLCLGDGTIYGEYSTVIGWGGGQVSSNWATAVGWDNHVTGNYAGAFGYQNIISSGYFVGMNNSGSGYSLGASNSLTYYGVAIGITNTVNATSAVVIGTNLKANSFHATYLGRWNTLRGVASSWDDKEDLLVIGNGSGDATSSRHNALSLYKGGELTVNDYFLTCEYKKVHDNATDTLFSLILNEDSLYSATLSINYNCENATDRQGKVGTYYIVCPVKGGSEVGYSYICASSTEVKTTGTIAETLSLDYVQATSTLYVLYKMDSSLDPTENNRYVSFTILSSTGVDSIYGYTKYKTLH